ncbi:MAG: transcription/translation regulatory transformer protein RfaH [Gammaproteobacteria bacterium]
MKSNDWYVVHTKPRQENVAVENLERQGFTTYCPKTLQPRRRRQSWKKVIEPLFPRYLFIQLNMDVDNVALIRSTLGVISLVRFGNQPAVMPESAIGFIRRQEQELVMDCTEHIRWKKGDVVEIIEGPLSGIKAIFHKRDSGERVLLMLDMLGQQNRLSVLGDSIIPVY